VAASWTVRRTCGLKRKEAPPPAAAAEVEKASPPATLVVLLAQRPRLHGLISRGDACRAIGAEQRERIARMLSKCSDELLKLNKHTIPASGFRVSDFLKLDACVVLPGGTPVRCFVILEYINTSPLF
jgi:hypothetical protein